MRIHLGSYEGVSAKKLQIFAHRDDKKLAEK